MSDSPFTRRLQDVLSRYEALQADETVTHSMWNNTRDNINSTELFLATGQLSRKCLKIYSLHF